MKSFLSLFVFLALAQTASANTPDYESCLSLVVDAALDASQLDEPWVDAKVNCYNEAKGADFDCYVATDHGDTLVFVAVRLSSSDFRQCTLESATLTKMM